MASGTTSAVVNFPNVAIRYAKIGMSNYNVPSVSRVTMTGGIVSNSLLDGMLFSATDATLRGITFDSNGATGATVTTLNAAVYDSLTATNNAGRAFYFKSGVGAIGSLYGSGNHGNGAWINGSLGEPHSG